MSKLLPLAAGAWSSDCWTLRMRALLSSFVLYVIMASGIGTGPTWLTYPGYWHFQFEFESWTFERMWVKFETRISPVLQWNEPLHIWGSSTACGDTWIYASDTTDCKPNLADLFFDRVKHKEPDCLTSVNASHEHFLRPSLTSIQTSLLKSSMHVVILSHWLHTILKEGNQSAPGHAVMCLGMAVC